MHTLHFDKIHSNGNDFIVIDRINHHISDELVQTHAKHLTDRHRGIGADGIILVDPPQTPEVDFTYRIINASGSEVCQCGNGAICFSHYIANKAYSTKHTISVEVCNRIMTLTRTKADADCATMTTLNMGKPCFIAGNIPCTLSEPKMWNRLDAAGYSIEGSAVSMGNPHLVTCVDDVNVASVQAIGEALQRNDVFPEQVNVGFMHIVDRSTIRLRVFERGVGETLSCGSGACAAVIVGHQHGLLERSAVVHTLGGYAEITWNEADNMVYYTSCAHHVFSGTTQLEV